MRLTAAFHIINQLLANIHTMLFRLINYSFTHSVYLHFCHFHHQNVAKIHIFYNTAKLLSKKWRNKTKLTTKLMAAIWYTNAQTAAIKLYKICISLAIIALLRVRHRLLRYSLLLLHLPLWV